MYQPIRAKLIVIINSASGTGHGNALADKLAALFRMEGVNAKIVLSKDGDDIVECAKRAVQENPDTVVAGGGDGTVNAVAGALAGTEVPLGVLPLGTLNHFAKDMDIPLDLAAAARALVHGRIRCIDVAEVNRRVFINNSSLGLYPDMVRERMRQHRRLGRGKWQALVRAAVSTLRFYSFLFVRLRLNGGERTWKTPFVFIGNNQYLVNGLRLGKRAALDRRVLCVFVAQRTGRWGLLRLAVRALLGRLGRAKDLDAMSTRAVRVEARRGRLPVSIDGEVAVMDTPLDYRIRPGALRVVVPDQQAAATGKDA